MFSDSLFFAAIDFETANYAPQSVCSVGIVIIKYGQPAEKIYRLIKPVPDFYNYWNTVIHGLDDSDTREAPPFPEVWAEIAPKIAGLPLVAHNSAFDSACLKAVFAAYGMAYPGYRFHCTCRLARKAFRGLKNYKLNTVAEYCGFELKNHHHALADAEAYNDED